jgi:hypothetical protein
MLIEILVGDGRDQSSPVLGGTPTTYGMQVADLQIDFPAGEKHVR